MRHIIVSTLAALAMWTTALWPGVATAACTKLRGYAQLCGDNNQLVLSQDPDHSVSCAEGMVCAGLTASGTSTATGTGTGTFYVRQAVPLTMSALGTATGNLVGTGTASYISVWTGAQSLGVSSLFESGAGLYRRYSGSNYLVLESYKDSAAYAPLVYLRHSHNSTLEVKTETVDGDQLGLVYFQGVKPGGGTPAFSSGAIIQAIQYGAAGTYVPAKLKLYTHSASGENTDQMVLLPDGSASFASALSVGGSVTAANKVIGTGGVLVNGSVGTQSLLSTATVTLSINTGTETGQIVTGADPRLTDTRVSTHVFELPNSIKTVTGTTTITETDVAQTAAGASKIPMAKTDSKIDVGWLPTGTGTAQVITGDDPRLTDARASTNTVYQGTTNVTFSTGTSTGTATSAALADNPKINVAASASGVTEDYIALGAAGGGLKSSGWQEYAEALIPSTTSTAKSIGVSNHPIPGLHLNGTVYLYGSTSQQLNIRAAANAGDWTLTFPGDDGAAGQVLRTDGGGATSWVDPLATHTHTVTEVGGAVSGSGTKPRLARWGTATGTSTATASYLGNSIVVDDGYTADVVGDFKVHGVTHLYGDADSTGGLELTGSILAGNITATPTANYVPKADAGGTLNDWVTKDSLYTYYGALATADTTVTATSTCVEVAYANVDVTATAALAVVSGSMSIGTGSASVVPCGMYIKDDSTVMDWSRTLAGPMSTSLGSSGSMAATGNWTFSGVAAHRIGLYLCNPTTGTTSCVLDAASNDWHNARLVVTMYGH